MKLKINGFFAIVKREIVNLSHDSDIRILVLIAPLFYSIFYASLYFNKTETDIPVVVVDQDGSTLSRQFINKLDAHQLISVTHNTADLTEAETLLKNDEVQSIIIIPKDFDAKLRSGRANTLKVLLNTQRFLHSNDINRAINEVGFDYAAESRMKVFNSKGIGAGQAEQMIEPLKEEVRFMYNPMLTYGDFLIPGVLMLILQQTLILGLAQSLAKEREENSLLRWYSDANGSTSAAITGKTIIYFFFFLVYSFFFITFHFWLFEVPSYAPVINTLALTALFLLVSISFTVLIGSFFKSKLGVLQIIAFSSYPFFFLTGFAWPLISFPDPLIWLGDLLPLKPFLAAFLKTFRMGGDVSLINPELKHLAILGVGYSLLAYLRMKYLFLRSVKQESRSPLP